MAGAVIEHMSQGRDKRQCSGVTAQGGVIQRADETISWPMFNQGLPAGGALQQTLGQARAIAFDFFIQRDHWRNTLGKPAPPKVVFGHQ